VGTGGGVGIGDRNQAEGLTRRDAWPRIGGRKCPFYGIVQTVIGKSITVRPPVNGYGDDVPARIKAARAENPVWSKNSCGILVPLQYPAEALPTTYLASGFLLANFL
jgi:hypothetical protein